MKKHELKCWPEFFTAIIEGKKRCEIRRDDRGFKVGDDLHLREWCPNNRDYTGRDATVVVTHIADGEAWGIVRGFVVMSIVERMYARKLNGDSVSMDEFFERIEKPGA